MSVVRFRCQYIFTVIEGRKYKPRFLAVVFRYYNAIMERIFDMLLYEFTCAVFQLLLAHYLGVISSRVTNFIDYS
jgi:hypothetical protein